MLTLWEISGLAVKDSGGGDVTVLAVTPSTVVLPDVHAALREAVGAQYEWNRIDHVRILHDLSHLTWAAHGESTEGKRLAAAVAELEAVATALNT